MWTYQILHLSRWHYLLVMCLVVLFAVPLHSQAQVGDCPDYAVYPEDVDMAYVRACSRCIEYALNEGLSDSSLPSYNLDLGVTPLPTIEVQAPSTNTPVPTSTTESTLTPTFTPTSTEDPLMTWTPSPTPTGTPIAYGYDWKKTFDFTTSDYASDGWVIDNGVYDAWGVWQSGVGWTLNPSASYQALTLQNYSLNNQLNYVVVSGSNCLGDNQLTQVKRTGIIASESGLLPHSFFVNSSTLATNLKLVFANVTCVPVIESLEVTGYGSCPFTSCDILTTPTPQPTFTPQPTPTLLPNQVDCGQPFQDDNQQIVEGLDGGSFLTYLGTTCYRVVPYIDITFPIDPANNQLLVEDVDLCFDDYAIDPMSIVGVPIPIRELLMLGVVFLFVRALRQL